MILAVVPAAGLSTRMGRPKLTLPFGERTVIECVVAALRAAGVDHVLVVVAPDAAELNRLATDAGAHVHALGVQTPDMRATVEAGLAWLDEHLQPQADDAWLLVPADHPTMVPAVVRQLIDARRANPQRSIFVPVHGGQRGHPTLLAWQHAAGIRQAPGGTGLNTYIRRHAAETLEIETPDKAILCDLDTPADFERLQMRQA